MKTKIIVGIMAVALFSCTKNFEELNTDKTRIQTVKGKSLDALFSTSLYSTFPGAGYQLVQNLYCDAQAQFFACTQQGFSSDRNVVNGFWMDIFWKAYLKGMGNLDVILRQTAPDAEKPDALAYSVARIWRSAIYLPVVDIYGPLPYSEFGNGKDSVFYDSQEAIYNDAFVSLAQSVKTIDSILKVRPTATIFGTADLMYGGNLQRWMKYANSLRLRAAIRLSTKFPDKAKTELLAALNAPGGLMTDNADNAWLKPSPPSSTNWFCFMYNWNEIRMSAAMYSLLKGYNDPRMPIYFAPAVKTGQFKAIRNGMTIVQMGQEENSVDNNSNFGTKFHGVRDTEPFGFMQAAETWFILAEAALNGWNVGYTAKECYEKGIESSFLQWGLTAAQIATYTNGTSRPVPLNDIYNTPALSNIPVAFGTTESVQREQIGTQKWLSLYPYGGPEAWAEFRRTNYPKLYPRLNNENTDASTDAGSMKRITYPPIENTVNKAGYDSGVRLLGGPDKTSTLLWWDN